MRQQRQSRRAALPLLVAVAIASEAPISAPAATAQVIMTQVIMGLPDDDKSYAGAARPLAGDAVTSGMSTIRELVLDAHSLVTHRRLAPDQAGRISTSIRQTVATLKSDPGAAALTEVLTLLDDGATQLATPMSGDSQLEALSKFEIAFARYPQLVDDPKWQPLR